MVVLTQCRLIERTFGIQYPGKFQGEQEPEEGNWHNVHPKNGQG